MAGTNIKQFATKTSPVLTDFLYLVSGSTDYNVTLNAIKTLFNIEDIDVWESSSLANGTTTYINIEDSTVYGAIQIEYLAKRTGRGYITGLLTLLVDDSHPNDVSVSDFKDATRYDNDDLGLTVDDGFISSGTIQLKCVVDASDANPVVFNYRIISKRVITV